MNIKKLFLSFLFAFYLIPAFAAGDSISYVPNIHGVIRPRWEIETETGKSRFQIRYARVSLDGKIAPILDYFLQADLCDQGKMKFLDGYARVRLAKGLTFQAGQFRMPFGVEPFRAPQNYIFSNRSFMQKQMCNFRKVGAKASYTIPTKAPILVEAGAFNAAGGITDHTKWSKKYAWGAKATLSLAGFKLSTGALSVMPESTRINFYDAALSWENRHLLISAEYMNEHYINAAYSDAHSYCAVVNYRHPAHLGIFSEWSVQGRFDGITRHWNGENDAELSPARNRITVGGTLTYRYKILFADVRLNYEKYFYHSGVTAPEGFGDKVVAEIAFRF